MIVVGVDGSKESEAALRWALEEAKLRGSGVRVIHAWSVPAPPGRVDFYPAELHDPGLYLEGAERFLSELVERVADAAGGVQVDSDALQGPPAETLVGASADAEMLVVGSRGRGGFASLLLGSVSHQCAQHAACPVVIVRARD